MDTLTLDSENGVSVMRRGKKIVRFLVSLTVVTAGSLTALGISPGDWPGALQTALWQIPGLIERAPAVSIVIALPIAASAIHAFFHRSQTRPGIGGPFFDEPALLDPPLARPGYSDRMAYLMAEFAELAYYVIEPNEGQVRQLIAAVDERGITTPKDIARFVNDYYATVRPDQLVHLAPLEQELAKADFEYVSHFNRGSTQGFISLRRTGIPLIVVAFRGSEKEVEDWLTNADALPTRLAEGDLASRVHSGFYAGFKSVRAEITAGIEAARQRLGDSGHRARVYFTGHSLGGALAMIATRELEFDGCGACYTFGAPRTADYNYFWRMKTPHYRVVNSSDMVPRVPPGAEIVLLDTLLSGIGYFTKRVPLAREGVDALRGLVDRLQHYRHAGDQRYLTDVAAGEWLEARVLANPSVIDRTQWLWRHLAVSGLGTPIKSHSMQVYRRKLAAIAQARLT